MTQVILIKIAFSDSGLESKEIEDILKISKPKVEYYLDQLLEKDLISKMTYADGFACTKRGRQYLFEKNLL
jgi:helix-turn-helix protein